MYLYVCDIYIYGHIDIYLCIYICIYNLCICMLSCFPGSRRRHHSGVGPEAGKLRGLEAQDAREAGAQEGQRLAASRLGDSKQVPWDLLESKFR